MSATLPALEFDEASHVYRLNGIVLPSVTKVLDFLDPYIERDGGAAAARGTIVHDACEYHDAGELDESGVPEECIGPLLAWKRFRQDLAFDVIAVEQIAAHPKHLYAGKIDRIVTLGGPRNMLAVLDIKSGAKSRKHMLQLAAYAELYRATTGEKVLQTACVYLGADGRYSVDWYSPLAGLDVFLAALKCYRWRTA
jgi:hypothetical protein